MYMVDPYCLTKGTPSCRGRFDGSNLPYLLNRFEGSDLGGRLCPRSSLLFAFSRTISFLRRGDAERICLPNERGSFLGNARGREAGRSSDRGIPLV